MKKILTIITCFSVLLFSGLVLAQGERDITGPLHDEIVAAGGQGGSVSGLPELALLQQRIQLEEARQIRSGNIQVAGKQIQFSEKANDKLEFKVNNAKADTKLQIRQEVNGEIRAQLSNGKNASIKIMPDTASETALTRLRLKNCNETMNCTIELKEVGQGNKTRLAYELKTERKSRLFGLFQARMQVQAQVDAETGEVIQTNKPWWAFLAVEPEE